MRVLIQDERSKKYFTPCGDWAKDAQEAEDFESHRRAYTVARASDIAEFNIILYSPLAGLLCSVDQGKN
jgi:hypothetical protein